MPLLYRNLHIHYFIQGILSALKKQGVLILPWKFFMLAYEKKNSSHKNIVN
jgi:hypothetical protein